MLSSLPIETILYRVAQAVRATDRRVGDRFFNLAIYLCNVRPTLPAIAQLSNRQPVGAVRRSLGGFALIPSGVGYRVSETLEIHRDAFFLPVAIAHGLGAVAAS